MKIKYEHFFLIVLLLVGAAIAAIFTKPTLLGLDLKGGVRVVLQIDKTKAPKDVKIKDIQSQVITILRKRVDISGATEPDLRPKGDDQVVIELPGIKDEARALRDLQSTARLEFRYFRDVQNVRHELARYKMEHKGEPGKKEEFLFTDTRDKRLLTKDEVTKEIIDKSPLIVSGSDLEPGKAKTDYESSTGQPVVSLEFNAKGTKAFADFTRSHEKELLAIILDNEILMVPEISEAITSGKAQISGSMTVEETVRLAGLLNAGALPAPLNVVQLQKVDASLGSDAVHSTEVAGLVGICLVLLFMILYYRLPGVLANIALVFYALFTLAIFKGIPVTLTLPGIAGFILSIGMAVDANILIFERLKEELRSGKTLKAAIDAGFTRAWSSIRDSNICSLITAAILFNFGTGPIKGFALTLGIGVLVSMFTAITVTRTMLHLLTNFGFAQNPKLYGLSVSWVSRQGGRWLDIIGKRNWYFALSAAVILPGLLFLSVRGLKLGIDFTGGSMVQVQFDKSVRTDISKVRAAVSTSNVPVEGIQSSEGNTYFIRTKTMTLGQSKGLVQHLGETVGKVSADSFDSIGPSISKELTRDALLAVLFSAALIILYLTYQFRQADILTGLKYGVSAIFATFHDVMVLIGIFAILGHFRHWEVDSLFVTAVLTVIGFSTHDTIVIFDRIRENWRHREKDELFEHVVNRSILQTFARSINTSFTVVLTLTALLLLGGPTIKLLNVTLLIGVISGTYSSIFNAAPIMVVWDNFSRRRKTGARRAPGEMKAMVTPPLSAPKPRPAAEAFQTEEGAAADAAAAKAKAVKSKRKRRY